MITEDTKSNKNSITISKNGYEIEVFDNGTIKYKNVKKKTSGIHQIIPLIEVNALLSEYYGEVNVLSSQDDQVVR